jgi:hypothetical protein
MLVLAGSSSFTSNEDLTQAIKRTAINTECLRLRNIFRDLRSTKQQFSCTTPREVSRGMEESHHLITSSSRIKLGRVLHTRRTEWPLIRFQSIVLRHDFSHILAGSNHLKSAQLCCDFIMTSPVSWNWDLLGSQESRAAMSLRPGLYFDVRVERKEQIEELKTGPSPVSHHSTLCKHPSLAIDHQNRTRTLSTSILREPVLVYLGLKNDRSIFLLPLFPYFGSKLKSRPTRGRLPNRSQLASYFGPAVSRKRTTYFVTNPPASHSLLYNHRQCGK